MLRWPHRIVGALGCFGGVGFGVLTALSSVPIGIGAVVAVAFATLVLLNLEVSLVVWTFASLFEATPALELAVKGATVLVFLAWLAAFAYRPGVLGDLLRRHGPLVAGVAGLVLWLTVSVAWSERPDVGLTLVSWYLAGVVFLMTSTLVADERHVRWVLAALVAGTAITALAGLGGTPFGAGLPFVDSAVLEDRLQGGLADPNFFASVLVAAIALSGGLLAGARGLLARAGLLALIGLFTLSVAATQSRGGLLAFLAAAVAAVLVLRGRRLVLLGLVGFLLAVSAVAFSASPDALERVTTFEEGGTGRTDIWKVSLAIARDHPVMGVGIGNFAVHSPRYVDQVGPLERVDLIAEDLLVAHSFYLELLTETGVIGLGLFLLVVGGGLAACWRAARRLDQLGERSLAALALSIFVAIVGVLAGGVFVSGGQDERLWVLLGLGPAMLAVASRRAASRTPERSPPVEAPPLREQPAPAMAGG